MIKALARANSLVGLGLTGLGLRHRLGLTGFGLGWG